MTPEEKKEYNRKWREAHPDYAKNKSKEWRENNKERQIEYGKLYREEHREELREYDRSHQEEHYERRKERLTSSKKSYKNALATNRKYGRTQKGRARKLYLNYVRNDREYNRGECTTTPEYIEKEIFTKSCFYCGDSEWSHLGCDRIDNSLPHTPENCICSCGVCNIERQILKMTVEEYREYKKNG